MDTEFRQVVERAYEACRNNCNQSWVLEPFEDCVGIFRGLLFGRTKAAAAAQFHGTVYAFRVIIDQRSLADPPRIQFEKPVEHPLVFRGTADFCFPAVGNEVFSCRLKPLNEIMDQFAEWFFNPPREGLSRAVNLDAAEKWRKDDEEFWKKIREAGTLTAVNSPGKT